LTGGLGWRKRGGPKRWLLAAAGVVVLIVVAAVIVVLARKPHDVSHPDISFTVTKTSATKRTAPPATADALAHFAWPRYGYDAARTREFTGEANLHPPLRKGWTLGHNGLLEFPPVIYGHTLYYMDDGATVKAVDTTNGHVDWQKSVGTLSAASPGLALKQKLLVVPTLSDDSHSPGDGQIVALSMHNGHELWHKSIPSGTEASPLVFGNVVYVADQAGQVFSLNVNNGHVNWTFHASSSVKGGAALEGDNLYVDDYGGHVYDINARTGRQIWVASADGGDLGFSSGTFYSTPAVAFGRVYVGNTSGFIYSFAASTGQLAWSFGTGAYVYASAAVADVPGLGPTVYMGSYNGDFYALNAQSGKVRWVHQDAHRDAISGSATIVNNVVYYSDLHDHLTTGLNATTGKVVFSFDDGAFTPVVADPEHIYLSGGYVLYQLNPVDKLTSTPTSPATRHTAAQRRAAQHGAAQHTPARLRAARVRAARKRAARARAGRRRASRLRAARRRAAGDRAVKPRRTATGRSHTVRAKPVSRVKPTLTPAQRAAFRLAARRRADAKRTEQRRAAAAAG
jgi:outer membrane protein assembly factor BamB